MKTTFRVAPIVSVLVLLTIPAWTQAPAGWGPELSMQIQRVEEVVPSPDGRLVAYTQSRAVMEPERSEWTKRIFLASADGARRFQLTQEEIGIGSVSFSSDGRFVCFLSTRAGKRNIYRIRVDGGEAESLTDWKGGIAAYRISPDGKWIAFAGSGPDEETDKARKEKREWRVVDANPRDNSLWVFPTEPDVEGRRLVRQLTTASYHVTNFDWSPDSLSIAFEHQPSPSEDIWPQSDLSEVDVRTGAVRVLAGTGAAEGEPRYSPDGRWLAYIRTADPARWPGSEHILLLPRQGGSPRDVTSSFDEGPSLAALEVWSSSGLIPRKGTGEFLGWSSDSSRLLFTGQKGMRHLLYAVSVEGSAKVVYGPENRVVRSAGLNTTGTSVGFSRESSDEPPEAFVMNLAGGAPIKVSTANADLPKLPPGKTRVIHWKSRDGLEIEGLLTLPFA